MKDLFLISSAKDFKKLWLGFYFLIPVVLLTMFVTPFVYRSGFDNTEYFKMLPFVFPFFVILVFALVFFRPAAKYVPLLMFIWELLCLLFFVQAAYMHLSTAFYMVDFSTLSLGDILHRAGSPFVSVCFIYVINMILCIAAFFLKQTREGKKQKDKPAKEKTEEVASK